SGPEMPGWHDLRRQKLSRSLRSLKVSPADCGLIPEHEPAAEPTNVSAPLNWMRTTDPRALGNPSIREDRVLLRGSGAKSRTSEVARLKETFEGPETDRRRPRRPRYCLSTNRR